jgi:aminoglycoside phosphotransferase (APT) family kinase protein
MRASVAVEDRHVPRLLETFELGTTGQLSAGPVAEGRVGSIWRLDTELGSWVVKPIAGDLGPEARAVLEDTTRFQEAARCAGVPTPAVRRTRAGEVVGDLGGVRVTVLSWVDLLGPDRGLDPVALGRLLARLHQVDYAGTLGLHPWYSEPVGADAWRDLVGALRRRGAPFADEIATLVPELVGLESLLGRRPRSVRTSHRDLWADNLRATAGGELCLIDFDDAGLADPSQELALILVEFADRDPARARLIREAYAEAGGPGRILGPTDFAMAIAALCHIVETGCRQWLAATTDDERDDNEGWVREFLERPLNRDAIERLL